MIESLEGLKREDIERIKTPIDLVEVRREWEQNLAKNIDIIRTTLESESSEHEHLKKEVESHIRSFVLFANELKKALEDIYTLPETISLPQVSSALFSNEKIQVAQILENVLHYVEDVEACLGKNKDAYKNLHDFVEKILLVTPNENWENQVAQNMEVLKHAIERKDSEAEASITDEITKCDSEIKKLETVISELRIEVGNPALSRIGRALIENKIIKCDEARSIIQENRDEYLNILSKDLQTELST